MYLFLYLCKPKHVVSILDLPVGKSFDMYILLYGMSLKFTLHLQNLQAIKEALVSIYFLVNFQAEPCLKSDSTYSIVEMQHITSVLLFQSSCVNT